MVYVYDILLNFNKDLIEYFEWEDSDNIKYAKKITLFKITRKAMRDILTKEIEFNDNFIKKTLKYELDGFTSKTSYTLFTDETLVVGVTIKNNRIDLVSRLLVDEEQEVIEIAEQIDYANIDYKILKDKVKDSFVLTRKEKLIKTMLYEEIKKLYKEKKFEKLKYLYYEYTGNENRNIKHIYNYLIDSLCDLNYNHKRLIDILELSNKNM